MPAAVKLCSTNYHVKEGDVCIVAQAVHDLRKTYDQTDRVGETYKFRHFAGTSIMRSWTRSCAMSVATHALADLS